MLIKIIEKVMTKYPFRTYLTILAIAAVLLTLPFLAVTGFPQ